MFQEPVANYERSPITSEQFRIQVVCFARGYAARLAIRHWIAPIVLRRYFKARAIEAQVFDKLSTRTPNVLEPTKFHVEKYTYRLLERLLPLTRNLSLENGPPDELVELFQELLWPRPGEIRLRKGSFEAPGLTCATRWFKPGTEKLDPIFSFPFGDESDVAMGRPTDQTDTPFCLRTRARHPAVKDGWSELGELGQRQAPFVSLKDFHALAYRGGNGQTKTAQAVREQALLHGGYGDNAGWSVEQVQDDESAGVVRVDDAILQALIIDLARAGEAIRKLHAWLNFAETLRRQWKSWRRAKIDKELESNVDFLYTTQSRRSTDSEQETSEEEKLEARADATQAELAKRQADSLPHHWAYGNQIYRWSHLLDLTAAAAVGEADFAWLLSNQTRRRVDIYIDREKRPTPVDNLFHEAYLKSVSGSKPSERPCVGTIHKYDEHTRVLTVKSKASEASSGRFVDFRIDDGTKISFAKGVADPSGDQSKTPIQRMKNCSGRDVSIRANRTGLARSVRVGFKPDPRSTRDDVSFPADSDALPSMEDLAAQISEVVEEFTKAAWRAMFDAKCKRFLRDGPIPTRGRPGGVSDDQRREILIWNGAHLLQRLERLVAPRDIAKRLNVLSQGLAYPGDGGDATAAEVEKTRERPKLPFLATVMLRVIDGIHGPILSRTDRVNEVAGWLQDHRLEISNEIANIDSRVLKDWVEEIFGVVHSTYSEMM